MDPTAREHPVEGDPSVDVDLERAEALLFELAHALRFVRLDDHTRPLHTAALAAKARVMSWRQQPPGREERRALIQELVELHEEAKQAPPSRRSVP